MSAIFAPANASLPEVLSSVVETMIMTHVDDLPIVEDVTAEMGGSNTFTRNQMGDLVVQEKARDKAVQFTGFDTGQLSFQLDTSRGLGFEVHLDDLRSSNWGVMVAETISRMTPRLMNNFMEESYKRIYDGQTLNDANGIVGAAGISRAHKVVSTDGSRKALFSDIAQFQTTFQELNSSGQVLGIISPATLRQLQVDPAVSTYLQNANLTADQLTQLGALTGNMRTGANATYNLNGMLLVVSNVLPKVIDGSAELGASATGDQVNIFLNLEPESTERPLIGGWGRRPEFIVDTESKKLERIVRYQADMWFGMKLKRAKWVCTYITNPAA